MLLLLLNCVSRVRLCAIQWAAACQASLSMGILQARILEWVAMPSSRGSSRSRDQTQVSCIAGRFFTAEPPGKPCCFYTFYQITAKRLFKLLSNAPPVRNNGLQVALVVKNPPSNAGDVRDATLIPGSGRSPGEGNGTLLPCSCL